jgi:UbiD family decarboxylase
MGFRDFRDYLQTLEKEGLLCRVQKEVNLDWEIAAVCRVAFQRIASDRRPALLFEEVAGHEMKVVVGALGASSGIYATAIGLSPGSLLETVAETWSRAIEQPIPPRLVESGPCKENILSDRELDLFSLPHPMWTVEHDPGYFITAPYVVTRDPETGIRNVGTYRVQIRDRARTSIQIGKSHHGLVHIRKNEARGRDTPVAVVIGADPTVGLASVTGIPYGIDELAVAGALCGEPIDLVRCETIDLEVPATSEIVIEGIIPAGVREDEGPFGEHLGYMGNPVDNQPVINVTCITHRNDALYQAFMSQKPPSESSKLKAIGRESAVYSHLKTYLGMDVVDVHMPESGGGSNLLIVSLNEPRPEDIWEAAWGAWSLLRAYCKITVVVDEEIDIRDSFEVEWALATHVRPDRDVHIVRSTPALGSDPSVGPWGMPKSQRRVGSKMLIDATKSHEYPPIALPPQEHLDTVMRNWAQYGIGDMS